MLNLKKIGGNCPGLRGFIKDLGKSLERRVRNKFGRLDKSMINVKFEDNNPQTFFILYLVYNGKQNNYSMKFSIEQDKDIEKILTINRVPGVEILTKPGFVYSRSKIPELRNSADMSEEIDGFLKEKFGDSKINEGNGYNLYRTELPEEYNPNPFFDR